MASINALSVALFNAAAGGYAAEMAGNTSGFANTAGPILEKDLSTDALFVEHLLGNLGVAFTSPVYAQAKAAVAGLVTAKGRAGAAIDAIDFLKAQEGGTSAYAVIAANFAAKVNAATLFTAANATERDITKLISGVTGVDTDVAATAAAVTAAVAAQKATDDAAAAAAAKAAADAAAKAASEAAATLKAAQDKAAADLSAANTAAAAAAKVASDAATAAAVKAAADAATAAATLKAAQDAAAAAATAAAEKAALEKAAAVAAVDITTDNAAAVTAALKAAAASAGVTGYEVMTDSQLIAAIKVTDNAAATAAADAAKATAEAATAAANAAKATALTYNGVTYASIEAYIAATTSSSKSFTLTTGVNTFTGGSGDDSFDASTSNSLSIGDNLTGGTGSDSVSATLTSANTTFTSTGIETFNFTVADAAPSIVNMANATGVTTINNMSSLDNLTLNNLAALPTVGLYSSVDTTTLNFSNAAMAGTADDLSFALNGTTAANITLTSASGATSTIETVSLDSGSVSNTIGTLSTTGVGATKLEITGTQALTITTALNSEIATVAAGDATGDLSFSMANRTTGSTVTTGSGADTITAGTGNDSINAGSGNDTIKYANSALTTNDSVAGGNGTDTIEFTTDGTTVADAAFTNVTSVETLTATAGSRLTLLTLGEKAAAAGVATVNLKDTTAVDSVVVGSGFTNNLTVDLDLGTNANSVVATGYTGVLTVTAADTDLNTSVSTLTGGSGSDILSITASGGTVAAADLASVTKIEKFTIVGTTASTSVALSNNNAAYTSATVYDTITVDASALTTGVATIDASAEANGKVVIVGGGAADVITGSTSANFGDSITGNAGADIFKFGATAGTPDLTSADTVSGGDGTDVIKFTAASTVGDALFTNVTSVATLTSDASIDVDYTLGALAMAAGVTTVTFAGDAGDSDSLIVGSGFTSALTVNLDSDATEGNTITATSYTGTLTVATDLANLNNAADLQTITGGTGTDTLAISLVATATGVAQTSITKVERFVVTDGDTAADVAGTVTLADENATYTSVLSYETITVDASALTTDTITIDASAEADAKVLVTAGAGADTIVGSTSSNFGDSLVGGSGADTFKFNATSLTSTDTVAGGDGTDVIKFTADATVADAQFTNVTSVATLTSDADIDVDYTLGALAAAAGVATVTFAGTAAGDTDTLVVGSGFTNNLRVNLDVGTDVGNSISATGYTGVLTVAATDGILNDAQKATITGGSGSDALAITVAGGTVAAADLANVTKVETFQVVGTTANAVIALSDNNAAYTSATSYDTVTVDASTLTTGTATIDASAELDGKVVVIGGAAGDSITASASANFGDNLSGGAGDDTFTITTAGFTSADTISGGDGDDTITLSDNATVVDADFTNVTSVKTMTSGNNNLTATLGSLATAASLTAITGGTGTNVITVGSGYTSALAVTFVAGTDKIVATGNTSGVTVNIAETSLTAADTLTGGSGSDTLKLTGDGGSGNYTNVSGFETIQTVGNTDVSITTVDGNVASGATLTINASTLTSTVLTFNGSAENSASASGNFAITTTGTGNHVITLGSGNDTYTSTSTGTDLVTATAGNNTISTGYGADTIIGGTGNDNMNGGADADTFKFITANLDANDTIAGGDGTDVLMMTDDAVVLDSDFTNVTSVATLTGGGTGIQLNVTLGSAASAAGLATVTLVNTADAQVDYVTVGSGFTSNLAVNLDADGAAANSVVATGYTGVLTINAIDTDLNDAVSTLTGGSGSDILNITGSGATLQAADTASWSAIETYNTVTNNIVDITLSEGNVTTGNTLTFNASSMTTAALAFNGGTQTAGGSLSVTTLGTGNHAVTLAAGADTYVGTGSGSTTITALAGADSITTGSGTDSVVAGDGNDTVVAGAGADTVTGGAGADSLTGGLAADTFIYSAVSDSYSASYDSITDWTTGTDKLQVTLNYSALTSAATVNAVATGAGVAGTTAVQDTLSGSRGEWVYDTTNSALIINFNNDNLITTADYKIALNAASTATATVNEGDVNFVITTGSGDDTITAGGGADTITGGSGADNITGGAGNDTIVLGAAGDIDTINFGATASANGSDTISGFTSGVDVLNLDPLLDGVTKGYAEYANGTTNFAAGNVIVIAGTTTIANAATAIAADTDVVATVGLIVVSDGTDTFVYYSTDLAANGTETLIATIAGVASADSLATGDFIFA